LLLKESVLYLKTCKHHEKSVQDSKTLTFNDIEEKVEILNRVHGQKELKRIRELNRHEFNFRKVRKGLKAFRKCAYFENYFSYLCSTLSFMV